MKVFECEHVGMMEIRFPFLFSAEKAKSDWNRRFSSLLQNWEQMWCCWSRTHNHFLSEWKSVFIQIALVNKSCPVHHSFINPFFFEHFQLWLLCPLKDNIMVPDLPCWSCRCCYRRSQCLHYVGQPGLELSSQSWQGDRSSFPHSRFHPCGPAGGQDHHHAQRSSREVE